MKGKIDIVVQHYFPFHFIALGAGLFVVAVFVAIQNPILSLVLFIASVLFTTTHHRLKIDLESKTYMDYLWVFGFKKGPEVAYENIELLYINEVDVASGYGVVTRVNIVDVVYKGFLKMDDNTSLFFGESKNEDKLVHKANELASKLGMKVEKNY